MIQTQSILREVIEVHNLDGDQRSLETNLIKYADWLSKTETSEQSEEIITLRDRHPGRFVELCSFHLSTLIEMPTDTLEIIDSKYQHNQNNGNDQMNHQNSLNIGHHQTSSPKSNHNIFWDKLFPTRHCQNNHQTPINQRNNNEMMSVIESLIDRLNTPECLQIEGIFRKSGNIARQKEFRRTLSEDWNNTTKASSMLANLTAHDMASLLKSLLKELPVPIFTVELVKLIRKISDLTSGGVNDAGVRIPLRPLEEAIAVAKQLKAMRICAVFLPRQNARLLGRLLDLLTGCLKHSDMNRMTTESLGTLFGVILFPPGKVPLKSVQYVYSNLSKLTATIIKNGRESLFSIPTSLAQDLRANCSREHHHNHNTSSLLQSSPLFIGDNAVSSSLSSLVDSGHVSEASTTLSSGETSDNELNSSSGSTTPLKTHLAYVQVANRETCQLPVNNNNRTLICGENSTSYILGASETEYAVAELYAHVHKMSAKVKAGNLKGRRLIEKFNASSYGGAISNTTEAHPNPSLINNPKLKRRTPEETETIRFGLQKKVKKMIRMQDHGSMCYPFLETISSPFRSNKTSKLDPVVQQEFDKATSISQPVVSTDEEEEEDVSPTRVFFDSDDNDEVYDGCCDELVDPFTRRRVSHVVDNEFSDVWLDEMLQLVRLRRTRSLGDVSEILG